MYLICRVTLQNHPIDGSCKIVITDIVVVERYVLVLHNLPRLRDQMAMQLYVYKLSRKNQQTAKFGAHRHCGSISKMVLFYYVVFKDQATESSNNFKDMSLLT